MKVFLKNKKSEVVLLALFVAMTTIIAYLPVFQNQFVPWDDPEYIYENNNIRSLNGEFFQWAFFDLYFANWHPLTWLSHAIDYRIWKLNPAGHHLTNVFLHGMNTFLVVILAISLSREAAAFRDYSGFPAYNNRIAVGVITGLLFGLHPLHVESVAWISERKDVLCAFFFLLSILAYIKYVKGCENDNQINPYSFFFNRRYLSTLGLFILSLLSKPMAVTLPVVLLILDWYPLGRLQAHKSTLVLTEKLPFFLLSMGSVIITFQAQHSGGAVSSLTHMPLFPRILISFKAPISYLGRMFWPSHLIPFYPYPQKQMVNPFAVEYFIPLLLVIALTTACFILFYRKKQSIWLTAWCYYIVTLLPVLGIIKLGDQSTADRYTYLPSIAPFLIFGIGSVWILDKLPVFNRRNTFMILAYFAFAVTLIISLSYLTNKQIHIWKNGETLWTREIETEPGVARAYLNRGKYYTETGQFIKALKDYTQAVILNPDSPKNFYNRGTCYFKLGLYEEALKDFTEAIGLSPIPVYEHYNNRAIVYAKMNRFSEALKDYAQAISLNPNSAETYYNRGNAYIRIGLYQEALHDYTQAIQLSPSPNSDYYNNRGIVYRLLGQYEDAFRDFNQVRMLRKNP